MRPKVEITRWATVFAIPWLAPSQWRQSSSFAISFYPTERVVVFSGKKLAYRQCDWPSVRFQREMPGIEKADVRARNIRLNALAQRAEKRIC